MGLAVMKSQPPLRLHIRCENCLRESSKVLEVPTDAYVPNDMCELAQEGYLDSVPFFCAHCESSIGKLFAISGGRVE
ncbi:hypothetical protein HJB86_14725 [Rhizobium sp. NZLR3b]|uniref:hypothetical protein n=1 Tax=Rhizobium sp. NZLR3b TaxID=2731101 RepID=UPI001C83D30D|nr:hypothetical protein [Rhizobium sp. NZLR3b]MBX5190162.1 hypothetical protein [Rhizobium sp. NZLR3b]